MDMEWTVAPEAPPTPEAPTMPDWVVVEPEPAVVEPAEPLAPELPAIEPELPAVEPAPDLPAIEPWSPETQPTAPLAPDAPPTIEPFAPWEPVAPWSPQAPQEAPLPVAWPTAPMITQKPASDPLGWLWGMLEPSRSPQPAAWSTPAPLALLDVILLPVGAMVAALLSFDWLFGPSGRSYRTMPHVTFAVASRHGAAVHYHLVNVRKFPVGGETYTDDDEFVFNVPIRVSGRKGVAGALDQMGIEYRKVD